MSRINKKKQALIQEGMARAQLRSGEFGTFLSTIQKPDVQSTDADELNKVCNVVKAMMSHSQCFDIYDIMNDYGRGATSSKNDTHSAPRKFEKWFGGRGDGSPDPDLPCGEIKMALAESKGVLSKSNPVLNIGRIQPTGCDYKDFKSSSCYKKMKNMAVTTYSTKTNKFVESFVFKADNPKWSTRVREDYEFYLKLYKDALKNNTRSSASSRVSSRTKSPNGCLQVRSDSIMMTKKFFKEVSEYYDK